MSVFIVNNARKIKVRQVLRYFLANDKYAFIDAVSQSDEIESGYDITLVSEILDYQTFLSNEILDNNTIDRIIHILEMSIDSYLKDE